MYTALSAIGVEKGINKRWVSISLTTPTVASLFQKYRKVFLTLNILPSSTPLYLDLETISNRYSAFTGTVAAMLLDNDQQALPTTLTAPVIETKTAKFSDAHRACYRVTPYHPLYGYTAAPENNTAVMLTREHPLTDYNHFYQHCMVSVNGLYHMIDTNGEDGVVVYGAMSNLRKSKQNQIGLLSFSNVCKLTYVPITESMVHKRLTQDMIDGLIPAEPYSKIGFIKINQDLTGKSVMLVLGGYLHACDSTLLTRVNDNEFQIDFQRYPLFDRYFESNQYLDLSSLGLSMTDRNPSQVSVGELLSDDVLLKYMTLQQSFFVVLDTPELFASKQFIKKTGMPGMFISYTQPVYPLVTGVGRMPEYWSVQEDSQWSVTVYDNLYRQKVYNTTDPLRLNSIGEADLPTDPEILSGAYFLELGRDLKPV